MTTRPKFLNLAQIRLPLTDIVVLLHRISGVGIFLFLPFILYCFAISLDPSLLAEQLTFLTHPFVKLIWLGLTWAWAFHVLAEIRLLLLELHIGIEVPAAQKSAALVVALSSLITVAVGVFLFGEYLW